MGKPGNSCDSVCGEPADGWYDREARALMLRGSSLLARARFPAARRSQRRQRLVRGADRQAGGGPPDRIATGLRTFRALPHRMEPIRTVNGVLWINDSKATNVASTTVAVQALERPFVLLLGGRHKGEPYTVLAEAAVVAAERSLPMASRATWSSRSRRRPPGDSGRNRLRRGPGLARRLAQPGDAVLLSPACSSYDMFQNYEDRGAQFRAAVEAI